MKKKISLLSILPLICSCNVEGQKVFQMIPDTNFYKGFCVQAASGAYSGPDHWARDVDLTYGENEGGPTGWVVEQHGCNFGLGDVYNKTTDKKPTLENGFYMFRDGSKCLGANPDTGSVYMEVNASEEYNHPRRSGEYWPHLILLNGFEGGAIKVSEASSLIYECDLTLRKLEKKMSDTEYQSGLHTAMFVLCMIVSTDNLLDGDTYFWYAPPIYDYRFPNGHGEGGGVDTGKGDATYKYIYQPDTTNILDEPITLNETRHLRLDLKEGIIRGLMYAKNAGYLPNSNINNLYLASFNTGWEVPGTFDVAMEMSNLKLNATFY